MTTNSKTIRRVSQLTATLIYNGNPQIARSEVMIGYTGRTITGYRGPRLSGSVNSCLHSTTGWSPCHIHCEAPYPYGSGNKVIVTGSYEISPIVSAMPNITTEAVETALAYLRGEIPTDVLLPAFIVELPQALGLIGQLKSALKVVRGNSLKDFAREIASGHLAYAFGIAPLISDLRKLRNMTKTIKKKVAYLSDFSRVEFKPIKVGISTQGNADFTCENTVVPCEAYDTPRWIKTSTQHASLFGWARLSRKLTHADTRAAYLDALGIGKIGSTIWEEIPFSFVADWVYRCGDILEGLDHSFFKGCLEINRVGFQSKVVCAAECRVRPLTYVAQMPVTTIGSLYGTVYNRSPNIPSTTNWGDPGVRQLTLSGSLVLQKALG